MKKHTIALLATSTIILMAFFIGSLVQASPSRYLAPITSATATTTVTQLAVGNASTTIAFDSYSNGRPYAFDSATLLLQVTASTSASVINMEYQFSDNNVDWYQNNLALPTATTTAQIGAYQSYIWTPATTATTTRAFTLPVPTRYVRVVLHALTANSFVYSSIVPKQESI